MKYIIERLGDISGETTHNTFDEAIKQLETEYPINDEGIRMTPDPEDDRILIWEVLDSGHKKVVWHFSGWHWDTGEFDISQGSLPGDKECLYKIAGDF